MLNIRTNAAIANNTNTEKEEKHVLVIHSYNTKISWTQAQMDGVDERFQDKAQDVTMYHEFLDAKRYPNLHYQETFLDYTKNKYEDTPLSVMMVGDDPELNIISGNREAYFPSLPIVFIGINNVQERLLNQSFLTGVFEKHSTVENVMEAARQTESDRVIVVTDSSSSNQENLHSIESGLLEYQNAPTIIEVKDVLDSEVETQLGEYAVTKKPLQFSMPNRSVKTVLACDLPYWFNP